MHYKHSSLKIDLVDFGPFEMMRLSAALEGQNAAVVDAQVQLVASMILLKKQIENNLN